MVMPLAAEDILSLLSSRVFSDDTSGDFNPNLLNLVDENGGTYLFRGNLPENDGSFCYSDLIASMNASLAPMGKSLSENVQLLDLSFLNYVAEAEMVEIEKKWFKANADSGQFWLDSLYGALINPCDLSDWLRKFILKHHDVDGLKALMTQLKSKMDAQNETDCAIYMHCNAGKDRTGEAAACYLMQFKGYSYDEAIQLDLQIADRPLRDLSVNAMRWYAFYLRDVMNLVSIGTIAGK